ncbi:MAG: hypothetical protein KGL39_37560 [Patescibacteria group bacterium]|nr:hypothetical protein [Patescibacteria group bacterium]
MTSFKRISILALALALFAVGSMFAATQSDITTGVQTLTSAGAATGTLDTSALTGDYTIKVQVTALTAGPARVCVEDTANATAFSDKTPVFCFDVNAGTIPGSGITQSVRAYQVPATRFGATNTKLRVYVYTLSGSSPSISVHGWLEQ